MSDRRREQLMKSNAERKLRRRWSFFRRVLRNSTDLEPLQPRTRTEPGQG